MDIRIDIRIELGVALFRKVAVVASLLRSMTSLATVVRFTIPGMSSLLLNDAC